MKQETLINQDKLFYPAAIDYTWSYCEYLGRYTDRNNNNFDLGIHIDNNGTVSAAIVYGNQEGDYLSGSLDTNQEHYEETLKRAKARRFCIENNYNIIHSRTAIHHFALLSHMIEAAQSKDYHYFKYMIIEIDALIKDADLDKNIFLRRLRTFMNFYLTDNDYDPLLDCNIISSQKEAEADLLKIVDVLVGLQFGNKTYFIQMKNEIEYFNFDLEEHEINLLFALNEFILVAQGDQKR